MGKIVKNIIDEGGRLGISSRGMGSLKEGKSGIMEVQKDFTLATAGDIVADPSGPNCFVNGIMENASFVFDIMNNKWVNQSDVCEGVVEEVKEVGNRSKKELEEKASKLFEKFLKSL
jgi:ABC-type polar amino acid transport system ATPase subunit